MNICLVIPPSPFLLDERVFASLGVLRVASSLEAAGHAVTVLDLSGVENHLDAVVACLSTVGPSIVGITATTPQVPAALELATVIRDTSPEVRLILGGPHATLVYASRRVSSGRAERHIRQVEDAFDVIVVGDGDFAIHTAIGDDPPKVVDADDTKSPHWMSSKDFDELPLPARHLIDMSSYHYEIDGRKATSIISQLGCPFRCGFCGGRSSRAFRVIRSRSAASVVREIAHLHQVYGYEGFMFQDDELNVNRGFVDLLKAICEYQDAHGVEFRMRGFIKSQLLTEEQAEWMYRAGWRWILTGFEAADDGILESISKGATLEENTRCVRIVKAAGMKIKALMSVGHPGESRESIAAISEWLIAEDVDDFDCTVITCYPGTPYYDQAIKHETLDGVWTYTHAKTGERLHSIDLDYTSTPDYYKGDPNDGYRAYVFTDHLDQAEIVELRDEVEATVRRELGIPYYQASAALRYEHSMGQGLPGFMLKYDPRANA